MKTVIELCVSHDSLYASILCLIGSTMLMGAYRGYDSNERSKYQRRSFSSSSFGDDLSKIHVRASCEYFILSLGTPTVQRESLISIGRNHGTRSNEPTTSYIFHVISNSVM